LPGAGVVRRVVSSPLDGESFRLAGYVAEDREFQILAACRPEYTG
jgi:hypothetical protein